MNREIGTSEVEMVGWPLVSIVTPFYNTDQYLAECIESVIKQTYKHYEYILVNNRSKDNSLEIAASYARRDSRIRIVTNDVFLSQPENYNRALRLISHQSKYCKIVQADDWIFENCLMEMVKVAESNPSVGIVGAYRLDDRWVNCDGLPYKSEVVSGKELCRMSLLEDLCVFGSATSIMFRSDIVRSRDPFYSVSSNHEDTEACYEILQKWDYGFVHKVLTFTRRENESITTGIRKFDPQYLSDKLIALMKYGHIYLSENEFQIRFKMVEDRLYGFLGERCIRWGNRKELIDYHKLALENQGHELSRARIYKCVFSLFISEILNFNWIKRLLVILIRTIR